MKLSLLSFAAIGVVCMGPSFTAQAESLRCAGKGEITLADGSTEYENVMFTLDANLKKNKIVKSNNSPVFLATLDNGFPLPVYFNANKFVLVTGKSLLLQGSSEDMGFTIQALYDASTESYQGSMTGVGVKERTLRAPTFSCSIQ